MLEGNIFYDIKEGTAATNNLPDRFDDLPKHDIEVFQAECIQNIYDARSDSAKKNNLPVEIDFIIDTMSKEQISNFKKIVGNGFFEKIYISNERSDSADISKLMGKVLQNARSDQNWLGLTIIEKNTTGLKGAEDPDRVQGTRSKFDALMRATNKNEKDEATSGGTFGKGSSVYTYSSGLWMWFAYSVIEEPWKHEAPLTDNLYLETKARFMGRGMIAPFVDHANRKSYLGHKWYCREENALPFINDEAHEQAEKFGIPRRAENDYGTSYFIPAFHPDDIETINPKDVIHKFRSDIIQKWFIPIYKNELICRISTNTADLEEIIIDKEYLEDSVPELRFKLEILDYYFNNNSQTKKNIKKLDLIVDLPEIKENYASEYPFATIQRKAVNHLIFKKLNQDENQFTGYNTVNRIALTRNNGMIINHYPFMDDPSDPSENKLNEYLGENKIEAIFFGGKSCINAESDEIRNHMDLFLSLAENPSHNMWINNERDLGRSRLKRFKKSPAPYPWNRVNHIYKDILNLIKKEFPKEDSIPQKKDICSFWKKMTHIPKIGDTSGGKRNFHYSTKEEGYNNGKYFWKLKITSNCKDDSIQLSFDHYLNTWETGKEKGFEVFGIPEFDKLTIMTGNKSVDEVILEPEESKEVIILTCDIRSNELFKNYQPILEIKDKII